MSAKPTIPTYLDLPATLRERMDAVARGRGVTLRAFVIDAIERSLTPARVRVDRYDQGGTRQDSVDLLRRIADHLRATGDFAGARSVESSLATLTEVRRTDEMPERPESIAWRQELPSTAVKTASKKPGKP